MTRTGIDTISDAISRQSSPQLVSPDLPFLDDETLEELRWQMAERWAGRSAVFQSMETLLGTGAAFLRGNARPSCCPVSLAMITFVRDYDEDGRRGKSFVVVTFALGIEEGEEEMNAEGWVSILDTNPPAEDCVATRNEAVVYALENPEVIGRAVDVLLPDYWMDELSEATAERFRKLVRELERRYLLPRDDIPAMP